MARLITTIDISIILHEFLNYVLIAILLSPPLYVLSFLSTDKFETRVWSLTFFILIAMIPLALQNSVDIELLIEGSRYELFEKITFRDSSLGVHSAAVIDNQALSFSIQRSYLTDDGLERIFEVKCGTFEHSYCAFEFKGYVACPAFLVSFFNVTDYACLDVRNGAYYYYIFLSRKDVDPLPIILGDSDFLGKFEIKIPSEAHRLLFLNRSTKDFKCFIYSPESPDDEALGEECSGFGKNPSDTVMKSKIVSSYWFATQNLRDLFRAKHTLFPHKYVSSNVLIHQDSKSFAEFQNVKKPKTENSENKKREITSSRSIFTATKYKREDYILNAFADHIRRNFKVSSKRKVKDYYCSMIAVLQSSGYGKSRLMDRFGGRTPTFYSSLQPGAGYPEKSFFLARLIEELDRIVLKYTYPSFCHMNNVSTAVYIYILRMLFVILNSSDNNPLKNTFKIDSGIKDHKFFSKTDSKDMPKKMEEIFEILFNGLEDICKDDASVIFNGNDTLELKNISEIQKFSPNKFAIGIYSEEALTCDLEGDVMKMLELLGVKGPTVLICN